MKSNFIEEQSRKTSQKKYHSKQNYSNAQFQNQQYPSSALTFQQCSVCFIKESPENIFILQCNHFICYECLKRQVKLKMLSSKSSQFKSQNIPQKILIRCHFQDCNAVTLLQEQEINSLKKSNINHNRNIEQNLLNSSYFSSQVQNSRTLSLKANRDLTATQIKNKTIFCITCNELLGLQQFLQSSHRNHQVQPLEKCFPEMQKNLAQTSQNLSKMRQSFYSNQIFFTHQKKKLNDEYNNNLMKIKIMFDNLKQAIVLKEKLVTEQYQCCMIQIFSQIDKKMKIVSQTMEECQKYQEWIESNLQITSLTSQSKEIIRCANFYVDNYLNINNFLSECQKIGRITKTRIHSNSLDTNQETKITLTNQNIKRIVEQLKSCEIILSKPQKQFKCSNLKNNEKIDSNYFSKKKKEIIVDHLYQEGNKNQKSFVSTFSSNGLSKVKSITNFMTKTSGNQQLNQMSIQDKINQLRNTLKKQNSQKSLYTKSIIFNN